MGELRNIVQINETLICLSAHLPRTFSHNNKKKSNNCNMPFCSDSGMVFSHQIYNTQDVTIVIWFVNVCVFHCYTNGTKHHTFVAHRHICVSLIMAIHRSHPLQNALEASTISQGIRPIVPAAHSPFVWLREVVILQLPEIELDQSVIPGDFPGNRSCTGITT
jgi:hypothetical protein